MIIMSVDLGKARTGIAVCDKTELLASPLKVIEEKNAQRLIEKVSGCAAECNAELIVVGLPKNMDNSEGESAKNARDFAQRLEAFCKIKVDMRDERGTTITAHNYLSANNVRGKKRKKTVDAVAAVIILQDYIDARKNAHNRGGISCPEKNNYQDV